MGELRSLFLRLGLNVDSANFAAAQGTVELLKAGISTVAELANRATDYLKEQVRATVEAGVQAKRMSNILGVSAQDYQRLAYAANVSEVSTEALTAATRRLAMKGIKDTTGYLIQMADRLHAMPEGAGRATVALQAFGRSGRELLPLLNKGGAAIRALMADADELGVVMSTEAVAAAEDYEVATKRLDFTWQGLRNTIVKAVLPAFTAWLKSTQETVKAFVKWYALPHEKLIASMKLLAVALGSVAIALIADAAGAAIAGFSMLDFAIAAGTAAAAAWSAVAAFGALALPFVAPVLAIAALIIFLDDLVSFLNGEDSLIGAAVNKWIGPFKDWRDGVKQVLGAIEQDLINWVPEIPFLGRLASIYGDIQQMFASNTTQPGNHKANFGAAVSQLGLDLLPSIQTVGGIIGGGAASPLASYQPAAAGPAFQGTPNWLGGGAAGHTTSITNNLVVNASGTDPAGVVKLVSDWHDTKCQEAAAATGG